MEEYLGTVKRLATSGTAKDTYILFGGNVLAAFLGFLSTLIIARALSIEEFGVFSAAINMVSILTSLSDIGVSTGVVNFVSGFLASGEKKRANLYAKAALVIKLTAVLFFALILLSIAPFAAKTFLATTDVTITYWVASVAISMIVSFFLPRLLQARKEFLRAVIADNAFYLSRLGFVFVLMLTGGLTLGLSLSSFIFASVITVLVGLAFLGVDFLKSKPKAEIYKKLMVFSGWLGVNRIISAISGRLDIQMLAALAGATATGLYSIPSRLASFVMVLATSFSSVLATRLAGFDNKGKEKVYLIKATLALLPVVAGIILWILIAHPFITILFGEKYVEAVPVFRALALAMVPFIFTVPAVSAIIYAMKKPKYIGLYSFFQITVIFILNYFLIPRFGVFGPTITLGTTYTILAIYTWLIVIKHYWINK